MKCPGQDSRYWQAGAIYEARCPQCGNDVEFFKDESMRRCRKCGHKFVNPTMDFGCATYCKYAEQCLGNLPPELLAKKEDLLKDRVAVEMKRYFKQDFKRIAHAMKVARYAEQIVREERGANPAVVLTAAYLHDIGAVEAQRKHGSADPKHLAIEGPAVAEALLKNLEARAELVEEVCGIIARYDHSGDDESLNFKILHDARGLADLEEKLKEGSPAPETPDFEPEKIAEGFLTATGRGLAGKLLG